MSENLQFSLLHKAKTEITSLRNRKKSDPIEAIIHFLTFFSSISTCLSLDYVKFQETHQETQQEKTTGLLTLTYSNISKDVSEIENLLGDDESFHRACFQFAPEILVFSKSPTTSSIGFLSQKFFFKKLVASDLVQVAVVTWDHAEGDRATTYKNIPTNLSDASNQSLDVILGYSVFTQKEHLLDVFRSIHSLHGLKIIVYNGSKPILSFEESVDDLTRRNSSIPRKMTPEMDFEPWLKFPSLKPFMKFFSFEPAFDTLYFRGRKVEIPPSSKKKKITHRVLGTLCVKFRKDPSDTSFIPEAQDKTAVFGYCSNVLTYFTLHEKIEDYSDISFDTALRDQDELKAFFSSNPDELTNLLNFISSHFNCAPIFNVLPGARKPPSRDILKKEAILSPPAAPSNSLRNNQSHNQSPSDLLKYKEKKKSRRQEDKENNNAMEKLTALRSDIKSLLCLISPDMSTEINKTSEDEVDQILKQFIQQCPK